MKMILQIFRKDARRISTNVVAVVVIMGLCILPCLYAWFNIISNWDPYGADATSNIKVAVYSEDKGIDISGIELNVGASVVSALESNTTIGWVFTQSASDGINGVYAGDYYAALIIPENFTENIISFAKGEVINPEIIYYENDKKNAIAPKITAKAKTAVQNQVNATFIGTIAETVTKIGNGISNITGGTIMSELDSQLDKTNSSFVQYINIIDSLITVTESAKGTVASTDALTSNFNTITSAGRSTISGMQSMLLTASQTTETMTMLVNYSLDLIEDNLTGISKKIENTLTVLTNTGDFVDISVDGVTQVVPYMRELFNGTITNTGIDENKYAGEIAAIRADFDRLENEINSLNSGKELTISEIKKVKDSIKNETDRCLMAVQSVKNSYNYTVKPKLNEDMYGLQASLMDASELLASMSGDFTDLTIDISKYSDSITKGTDSLKASRAEAEEVLNNINMISDRLKVLSDSESFNEMINIITSDSVNASEFAESPVYMETEKIYPIETYGSQMAAFYTILAIWFGSLILVAIIHVTVHEGDGITGVKPWQAYFGRYITFFLIGQVQALLTVLGNVYYIEIQCIHPFLYWFATSQCSFMFTIFIYSLTVAFGNVGEALAVIIMVIQVAGAGGTFPIEVLPKAYQLIYNYLPFKFGMTAIKETIGGMYRLDYLKSIMSLYAYVGISLIIGILVAIPFRRLNKMIEHSKEKTGFMI